MMRPFMRLQSCGVESLRVPATIPRLKAARSETTPRYLATPLASAILSDLDKWRASRARQNTSISALSHHAVAPSLAEQSLVEQRREVPAFIDVLIQLREKDETLGNAALAFWEQAKQASPWLRDPELRDSQLRDPQLRDPEASRPAGGYVQLVWDSPRLHLDVDVHADRIDWFFRSDKKQGAGVSRAIVVAPALRALLEAFTSFE